MIDVETIKANGLCAGCGLCAGIGTGPGPAIVMRDSAQGFRRPEVVGRVDEAQQSMIDRVCPGINIRHDPQRLEAAYHPVWGPVVAARLGWANDAGLRQNASSGGGLSAILVHLLNAGEIDYVIQTAVSDTSPIRNALAISTGRDDVFHAAGSRYAPSSPLEDIASRLDAPGKFAFVGKPCDVAALRQLSRHDPRVSAKVPYMIAFFCAGVPSYRGTSALLSELGVTDESEVTSFRYRGDGWPGFAKAKLADGTQFMMDYDTSWGSILNRHLQFRCKICPDGTGEFADIVCADGWHCDEQGNPLFDEQDGRSIVLSRTDKGEALIQRVIETGDLATQSLALETISKMQPFQSRRKGLVFWRLKAMAVLGRRRPRYRNLELASNGLALGAKEGLRSFLGTLRRLIRGGERS